MWSYNPNELDELDLNKTVNNNSNRNNENNINDNNDRVKFSIFDQDLEQNTTANKNNNNNSHFTSQNSSENNLLDESYKFPILKKIWEKK